MNEEINDYLHYLTIERGLSLNTRKSYERDLLQYLHYLEDEQITSWQDVDRYVVINYLEKMHDEKKAPATVTRMITSLRRFHQFLRQERLTDHDPMQHIDTPKKVQKLPSTLSLTEVEQLKPVKGYIPKPVKTESVFKSEEAIREEIYEKIAEGCEDVEEFERKIKEKDVEIMIANRIKKQDVVIQLFEEECDHNLSELDLKLQQREIRKRLLEEFKRIDEEDGIMQIYAKN